MNVSRCFTWGMPLIGYEIGSTCEVIMCVKLQIFSIHIYLFDHVEETILNIEVV